MTRKEIWNIKKEVIARFLAELNYAELSELGSMVEANKKYREKMAVFKFHAEEQLRKADVDERFRDAMKGY